MTANKGGAGSGGGVMQGVPFRLGFTKRLAELAARIEKSVGDDPAWRFLHNKAIGALEARILGVNMHAREVTRWDLVVRPKEVTGRLPVNHLALQYHLGDLLFDMESATECLVFAANAIGFALHHDDFRNVADEAQRRAVGPADIWGDRSPVAGYRKHLPRFHEAWLTERAFIRKLKDLHECSKHRGQEPFVGGTLRSDPPAEIAEMMKARPEVGVWLTPFAEVFLDPEPKGGSDAPIAREAALPLEHVVEQFCSFVDRAGNGLVLDLEPIVAALLRDRL